CRHRHRACEPGVWRGCARARQAKVLTIGSNGPMADEPDNDLDAIAAQLNATSQDRGVTTSPGRMEPWLRVLGDAGGSDLLLVAGEPPIIRVQGGMKRLDGPVLDGDDIVNAVLPSLPLH